MQSVFLPSTIHMTMILPPVAIRIITPKNSDQQSLGHHGKSNGRSWSTKMQLDSNSRRKSRCVDLFNASSIKWASSLRFSFESNVTLCSKIHALQLYKRSITELFIFAMSAFGEVLEFCSISLFLVSSSK